MHTHQRPLRILSVALLCACSAHAGTALRFGPSSDYVTATTDFARRAQSAAPANASETRWLAPFEEEAPIIATSESYAGPTVHGGYEFISDNTHVLLTRQQIRERKGRPDSLALQAHSPDSWEGRSLALRGFFLFKQDAFESEYRAGPFTPDRLAASWNSYAAGDRRNITGRYVVKIGDSYHISEHSFGMTNSGSDTVPAAVLATLRWAPYDPVTALDFEQGRAVFQKLPLIGVTAVGLYFEDDSWTGDNSASSPFAMHIETFTVSGAIH